MNYTFDEASHPRQKTGEFASKSHSAPTGLAAPELTPHQLAMLGMGVDSPNVWAEPLDGAEGERPLRPYLPLTAGDDDELFDAPIGSTLRVQHEDSSGKVTVRTFELFERDRKWSELGPRGVPSSVCLDTGEVWGELFREDGTMRSNMLSPPPGILYGDHHWYVDRATVDEPLTAESAAERLNGQRAVFVSRSHFGDTREDGIPAVWQRGVSVTVDDTGYLKYATVGRGRQATRSLNLNEAHIEVFDRGGDIVIRREQDAGFGWEEVLRVVR